MIQRKRDDIDAAIEIDGTPPLDSGEKTQFFRRIDWIACGVCFLIAFGVYFFTLAPTVTLEDSGEMAVASDYLGVPHPPGYPIWTLVTWLFQLVFHWVEYNGHPNPAWSVGLSSGFFGAGACAILALLISRSGSEMLRSIDKITTTLGERLENWLCLTAGVSGGLLFAFSPVLWSQSTIVEVYSLNAFFLMLVLVFLYMWMCRPREMKWMYAMAFSFGLGLTNHQSLMFMGLPVVAAVFLNEFKDWRDLLLPAGILLVFILGLLTSVLWIFIAIAFIMALFLKRMPLLRDFALLGLVMFAMFHTSGWMGKVELDAGNEAEAYNLAKQWVHQLSWSIGGIAQPGFWVWTGMAVFVPALVAMPRRWKPNFALCALFPVGLFIANGVISYSEAASSWQWSLDVAAKGFWCWSLLALAGCIAVWRIPRRNAYYALGGLFVVVFLLAQNWALQSGRVSLLMFPNAEAIAGSEAFQAMNSPPDLPTIATAIAMMHDMAPGLAPLTWLLLIVIVGLFLFYDLPNGRAVGITFLLMELGVSFYLMMPIASDQNPPMNWGYPRTWTGFMHAVTRGQYEKINPIVNAQKIITDPIYFLRQNYAVIFDPKGCISVVAQFTLFIAVLALAPFFFFAKISRKMSNWLIVSLVAFISMTTIFIVFQYPKLDIQTLFIGRVQYIQAHAIFALWIGYGAIFAIAALDMLFKRKPAVVFGSLALIALLPLVPVLRNAYDRDLIELAGSADQQGHDFGWQFGYYQLRGADGILEELTPAEREDYPNPEYPAEMGANAIFFGGTDPGRFVPTYMIYSADVRPDVHLITQNALADATYMNVMRDLYGDDIWIPGAHSINRAFEQYVDDIESGRVKAGADVKIEDGRVSVQGVGGVMVINSILARMIFDNNRYTQSPEIIDLFQRGEEIAQTGARVMNVDGVARPVREFYVEESYAIEWMYPYLEPHGLIMKLNPQPIELTEEMVRNDQEFWRWYSDRLLGRRAFKRDVVARKSFSKLRSSIAGLYVYRKRYNDAVIAFKQSIALYSLSPEANYRLADTYMRMNDWESAKETMRAFIARDTSNDRARQFLKSVEQREQLHRMKEIYEARLAAGRSLSMNEQLQLANVYLGMGDMRNFERLARRIIADESHPPEAYHEIARLATQVANIRLVEAAVRRYIERWPNDYSGWINLAALEVHKGNIRGALVDIKKAIEIGGSDARRVILRDERFKSIANNRSFRSIVAPSGRSTGGNTRQLSPELQRLFK